ncbi:2OG-Fe(II) oxygenase [Mangrovimicrobium sediminis]|uniref:2OG-Fe(II) oxygenase n=1 Tax=Mangrovimicrobium sediminis TaxID=2562682 RepID=A0A4Z0M5R4_9GAMM|nr:2OG-Fe(II) oxygenase [Haliea sp. SAOS-164]TGD74834.1 2OG-Fe(II) oxygenase [Haliea sp. SAOS-164]
MNPVTRLDPSTATPADDLLFASIASDVRQHGYSINTMALPPTLAQALGEHVRDMHPDLFAPAATGRQLERSRNAFVRRDEICWITGAALAGREWLDWAERLRVYLNRELLLGLFSFESHFAHYAPGDFYRRHYDAFRGETNRVLSLVAYLNPGWQPDEKGELVLYRDGEDQEGIRVVPALGSVVVFLSEDFPHEVLPAARDRYSIAGWFRVNTSIGGRIDPPR